MPENLLKPNTPEIDKCNNPINTRYKIFYYIAFLMPILLPGLIVLGMLILDEIDPQVENYINDHINKYIKNIGLLIVLSLALGWPQYLIYLAIALFIIKRSKTKRDLIFIIYVGPFLFSLIAPFYTASRMHDSAITELLTYSIPVCYGYVIVTEALYYSLRKKLKL